MIEKPFADIDSWLAFFTQASMPVLRHTEKRLAELRADAGKSNARLISSVILHDPMMTLRVLAYIEAKRNKSRLTDITTIERALMMMGMEPFFRDFNDLPLVEDRLQQHPQSLLGLLRVVNRARKATHWARDWAIYRHDLDVDEIAVATLLYDFSEILMWCFAPALALEAFNKQKANRALRSVQVQTEVFNVPLYQLKEALAHAWRLPELLIKLMDPQHADHPRVKNVKLAVDLARHSANGWNDAAIPDDFRAIGDLLHLNQDAVIRRLGLTKEFPATTDAPHTGAPSADQPQ